MPKLISISMMDMFESKEDDDVAGGFFQSSKGMAFESTCMRFI